MIKSRLSELQSARRGVVRSCGAADRADCSRMSKRMWFRRRGGRCSAMISQPLYDLLKNRLVFLDGGKDDIFFLEHYVLLGNYVRDPDRFEAMDELFQDFLAIRAGDGAGAGLCRSAAGTSGLCSIWRRRCATEIANLEEQRESLRKRLDRGESFLNKFLSSGDPCGYEGVAE